MFKPLSILLLLVAAVPVRAEWLEAQTDHFVVYGDTDERNLRRFAEQLERFDGAMAVVTGVARSKPTPSTRVTIYITGGEDKLRKLYAQDGRSARYIGGFYMPRLEGSVAFVPEVIAARDGYSDIDTSMLILLHEYAHHFVFANSRFPTPRWLGEGVAEFFASASFGSDGSVTLGRAAKHRAAELYLAPDVTATDLVDAEHYEKRRGKGLRYDAYYGRAWLLFHYLTFEPSRKGQLAAYIKALANGTPSRAAAEAVFGDLVKLDRDLDGYMRRRSLQLLSIKGDALPVGDIAIRTLRPGEAAIMPVVMRSKRGAGSKALAEEIVAEARTVAARFPADAAVLAALAEAEFDAGNDEAALAAADAALAIDPLRVNAHVQKGLALFRKAETSGDAETMRAARRAFMALNRIENDNPVPLYYFYLSYSSNGSQPTENAVTALKQAAGLVPYAHEVVLALAHRHLLDGQPAAARNALLPVAYNPHGGRFAERLREFLTKLDAAAAGDSAALATALRSLAGDDGAEDADPGAGSKIAVQRP